MTASERIREARSAKTAETRKSLAALTVGPNSHLRFGAPRTFIPTDKHGNELCKP